MIIWRDGVTRSTCWWTCHDAHADMRGVTRIVLVNLASLAQPVLADTFVRPDIITDPTPARFSVCSEHTCKRVTVVGLQPEQWQRERRLFLPPPLDAVQERERIAQAIALMEAMVGPLTGTEQDKGRNFQGVGIEGQMDCIDESTNTTTYLTMLLKDGLLKWHSVEDRATRGFFIFGWPHTTAVIREAGSDALFAVDSWFLDNGQPPYIQKLEDWRDKKDFDE
ncbi:MAG: hypothetical protein HY028_00920 [Gammaproteobacteria bacterium]|nr:hypothetical protein [Gammaproteobacteria bacterium]